MKKALMILMATTLFLLGAPLVSYALIGPHYYSNPNPTGQYDPKDLGPHNWAWVYEGSPWIEYDAGSPPWPISLNQGDSLLLGMDNYTDTTMYKRLELKVYYSHEGNGNLKWQDSGCDWDYRKSAGDYPTYNAEELDSVLVLTIYYPQPEWEWFLFKNVGTASLDIDSVKMSTECDPIPSLTEWGLVGLVVLLLGAGVMVIVRRRRVAVRT